MELQETLLHPRKDQEKGAGLHLTDTLAKDSRHVLSCCLTRSVPCSAYKEDWSVLTYVRRLSTEPDTPWRWTPTNIAAICLACVVKLPSPDAGIIDLKGHPQQMQALELSHEACQCKGSVIPQTFVGLACCYCLCMSVCGRGMLTSFLQSACCAPL